MTTYFLSRDFNELEDQGYSAAAIVCALGFFLRLFLSAPVLNILGIDYGSDDAGALSKIHPGSYLIILSFFILISSHANPLAQIIKIARQHTAFFSLLIIYCVIFCYWIIRGPKGVGLILDIHIGMPICAIVFSYAPPRYCRNIVNIFVIFGIINSCVGLFEAITHLRIFSFDPDWEVLHQDYFRASAFLGHPLSNASFTVIALFVLLSLRISIVPKIAGLLTMLSSLVAFGGRSALILGIMGLLVFGFVAGSRYLLSYSLSIKKLLSALLCLLLIPALCFGLLSLTLKSGIGERLIAYESFEDDSATVRLASFDVFDYMNREDILLGIDGDKIAAISSHSGMSSPTSDIENPWVLIFMFFGAIFFILWLSGLLAVIGVVLTGALFPLKIALIEYFLIASTSNSFGRKDAMYIIVIGIIVCAKRMPMIAKTDRSIIHD